MSTLTSRMSNPMMKENALNISIMLVYPEFFPRPCFLCRNQLRFSLQYVTTFSEHLQGFMGCFLLDIWTLL